ncbi:kinase-like protein [Schizopora paradoxa]|uniref:Kinase-like protein n=1 Tax=Schizopora paradoxa TaxID=27342 RepID=A0A0H2R5L1_9AGAM|nr:kinase-like protein [Schizopora paradoxa]
MESPPFLMDSDENCYPSVRRGLKDIFSSLEDLNLAGLIEDREREQLALGSSCDIFRARSIKHNKRVAIKRIRCFLMDDVCFENILEREVRLWSRLKHPNVLPLLGFFLEGKRALPNLVSEWMGGGTLTTYMKDRPLDALEISKMARKTSLYGIAGGLRYIHDEHSMIHADLKSSNILVSSGGRPVLADFGLTTMSDIWAFGMVISELLTRMVPYALISDLYVANVILSGQLPQKPEFEDIQNRNVFEILWKICQQCWKDIPEHRPSASEVHEKLEILGIGFSMGRSIACESHHLEDNVALLEDTLHCVESLNSNLSDALEAEKLNVAELKNKIHELENNIADLEWDLEFERRKKVSIEF